MEGAHCYQPAGKFLIAFPNEAQIELRHYTTHSTNRAKEKKKEKSALVAKKKSTEM